MRILILANNDAGLYLFRKELLEELVKNNNTVYVSLPYGNRVKELETLGCKYIKTEIDRRGMNPFKDLRLLYTYFKLIRKIKPNCVLTYTVKPNVYGGIVCSVCGVPYIANITGLGTGLESSGFLKRLVGFLYKIAMLRVSCLFFQNRENQMEFNKIGITTQKERLIPGSGINTEEYVLAKYPHDNSIIKLVFIGRVMEAKGVNELVEAIQQLNNEQQKIELEVIGFCEDGYAKIVETWSKQNLVRYCGEQKNVKPFIVRCHALIHPSYYEGMSNVCLEAASMGRPVLASDISGCREIVDDGVTGFLFKPKSSQAIVEALNKFMLLTCQQRAEMGKKGREKVKKKFDRHIVIDAYMQEINKILRRKY